MTQLQSLPGTIGCRDHGGADAPCRGGSAGPAAELAKRAARMAWILKRRRHRRRYVLDIASAVFAKALLGHF